MATIPAACQCGKRFQANEKLAGKRVKCPACGAAIDIPAAPSAADPFGLSGLEQAAPLQGNSLGIPPQASPYLSGYAAQPNYAQASYAQPQARSKGNKNTVLIVGIIAGAAGLGFLTLIGLALLVPAVQAAREAARRQAANNDLAANAPAPQNVAGQGAPAAGASKTGTWRIHVSAAGRYSVLMPPNVQSRSQSEPTAAGLVTAYMAIADTGAQGAYFVAHSDMPVSANQISADDALDGACTGSVTRVGGTETSRSTITFAGQPGRDLQFGGTQAGRQFQSHLKVFLAGRRLYQVMWVGPAGMKPEGDVQAFFDSFKLTGTADTASTPSPPGGVHRQAAANPPAASGPPNESSRKLIYREATRHRRPIETITQQRDKFASQGVDTAKLDAKIAEMQKSADDQMQSICERRGITREQLDEIIAEGDANGW